MVELPTEAAIAEWQREHHVEFWKVRVVLRGGAVLKLASETEPVLMSSRVGRRYVEADWIDHHECGETKSYIDWDEVVAITWRFVPKS